jgi:hypothetical protein
MRACPRPNDILISRQDRFHYRDNYRALPPGGLECIASHSSTDLAITGSGVLGLFELIPHSQSSKSDMNEATAFL